MNPYDPRRPAGPPPGALPAWGPPQGSPGYPPHGYAPYPQQAPYPAQAHYPHAAPPRPRKGMGAGVVVAIVAGLLVVVGGVGATIAYFVLTGASSTQLSEDSDQSAALKAKAEALRLAVGTHDPKQVEDPLLEFGTLPDNAKVWFTETFGPEVGEDLYGYWDRQIFAKLPELIVPFKTANDSGRIEVRVTRLASEADLAACQTDFCRYQQKDNLTKLFKAMKKPQALYFVSLAKPGSKPGTDDDDVYYFAIVKRQFAYVGQMHMN
jgi:hypothetical protein